MSRGEFWRQESSWNRSGIGSINPPRDMREVSEHARDADVNTVKTVALGVKVFQSLVPLDQFCRKHSRKGIIADAETLQKTFDDSWQ
eukprot:gene22672-biopygen8156